MSRGTRAPRLAAALALTLLLAAPRHVPACTSIFHSTYGETWREIDPWGYGFPVLRSRGWIEVDACLTETEIAFKSSVDFTWRGFKARWIDYLTWNVLWRPPTVNEVRTLSAGNLGTIFTAIACGPEAMARSGNWAGMPGMQHMCTLPDYAADWVMASHFGIVWGQCFYEDGAHPRWVAKDQIRLLVEHHPIIDEIGWDNDVYFDKIWLRTFNGSHCETAGCGWGVQLDVRQIDKIVNGLPFECYANTVTHLANADHPQSVWAKGKAEIDQSLRAMIGTALADQMPVCGDVNGNGRFDPVDVQQAGNHGCNPPPNPCGTGNILHCGDVNNDGVFDDSDVLRMMAGNLACTNDPLTRLFGLRGNLHDFIRPLPESVIREIMRPFVRLLAP